MIRQNPCKQGPLSWSPSVQKPRKNLHEGKTQTTRAGSVHKQTQTRLVLSLNAKSNLVYRENLVDATDIHECINVILRNC